MFDITQVEKEAREEVAKEQAAAAKGKIKTKLAEIARAKKIVSTLEVEYQALLAEIGSVGVA